MQVYFFKFCTSKIIVKIISYWIKRHIQPRKHFGSVVNLKNLNSMTILEGHSVAE